MPRRKGPRQSGRIGLVQFVSVEVAALAAVITGYAFPSLPMVATGSVAALLVVPVVVRFRGRWWYEAAGAWLNLRGRRSDGAHAAVRARSAGPHWPELAALSPRLRLKTVADRTQLLGIGEDHLGWFAGVAVAAPDGLSRNGREPLRLEWITRLADPLTTVAVVVRHTPGSGFGLPSTPSSQSYQLLREALAVPPQRDIWIAVRVGQLDAATAAADRGELAVHRLLGSSVSRIRDALTAHGIDHWILDGPGLRQALVGAYGPEPHDPRLTRRIPHESWSRWRAGRTQHVCFAVTHWPPGEAPDLLARLADIPGATAVCTAVTTGAIRRVGDDEGPTGIRVLVRVVAPPAAMAPCLRQLHASARRLRVGLVRLDGEQAPAVYATMPTAANDGWGRAL